MALAVELPVDGLSYRGFAQMLYDVLEELGVPTKKVEYIYRGELGPDELQGHIVIHLRVPGSETLPELHVFQELQVEISITACV
ncbi:unnamed protein product [Miscanthus lutarioriparius]|uniref:Uncharacterized protein n=1 Tax=Miscanthus lutarioriparius TaxID=422564 RepID=A0A811RQY3_9POAL|nr:unnamed protein product [Miscanthus lutarioriparius]